jgi:hypothetical protein
MRELHPSGADPDQHQVLDSAIALEDLVREARNRPNDGGAIEENRSRIGHYCDTKKPPRPEPGGLSNE